SRNSSPLLWIL
ncbi:AMP-binding enzyme family protein, partial [Vibrio parahaemolyticus V-223/04]